LWGSEYFKKSLYICLRRAWWCQLVLPPVRFSNFFRKHEITAEEKHLKKASALPRSYGQRPELAGGISPRGLTCHCLYKAGHIYSAPMLICRVVLLLRQRRGAACLGEPQWARGQNKYFTTAPAHAQHALHGTHSTRGSSQVKLLLSKAKSKTRSKQNKDMHKFSSVYSGECPSRF